MRTSATSKLLGMTLLVTTVVCAGCSSSSSTTHPYAAVAVDLPSSPRRAPVSESRRHFEQFTKYFAIGHYGTALYALTELKRIHPAALSVDYHMGLVFGNLGVPSIARSKLSYVLDRSTNTLLKNRCSLALIRISEGEVLDEHFILDP